MLGVLIYASTLAGNGERRFETGKKADRLVTVIHRHKPKPKPLTPLRILRADIPPIH